jgi:hypothetical protein
MSEHNYTDDLGQTTFTRIRNMAEAGNPMPKKFIKANSHKLKDTHKWLWRLTTLASVLLYSYLTYKLFQWLIM